MIDAPPDFQTWKRDELARLLEVAVELFEMEPDCAEVGSDRWVWLHQARECLNG